MRADDRQAVARGGADAGEGPQDAALAQRRIEIERVAQDRRDRRGIRGLVGAVILATTADQELAGDQRVDDEADMGVVADDAALGGEIGGRHQDGHRSPARPNRHDR